MDNTTILVKNKTRERLREIGKKNQTYDQLINELIKVKISQADLADRRFEDLQSSESENPQ
jgi:hypothetical protein